MKKHKKKGIIKTILLNHIQNNLKDYCILLLLFVIGIIIGVIFINNTSVEQKNEITTYMNTFIHTLKENPNLNYGDLLKDSLIQNLLLAVALWFSGTAIMLLPFIYGMVVFRGFCLGYTISSIVAILGSGQGTLFVLLGLLLQNIFFIPALLALAGSGIRLYKTIIKDKRRDNIKLEIYKHSIFCFIIAILLVISSLLEVYLSSNLLITYVTWI